MKKAFLFIIEIIKACLNILMGALCFIKIDHDVAHIPNADGGIGRFDYYYSIYDKLLRENQQFLVYIALAVMAVSVVLSVFAVAIKDNRKIRIAGNIIFALSVIFFFVLLFYTMQIQYGY